MIINLEDKPNTREKIMNNKRKYMISMQKIVGTIVTRIIQLGETYRVGIHRRFYEEVEFELSTCSVVMEE